MAGAEALTRDEEVDVAGIFSALLRRWWLILLVTLATAVGLFMFLSSIDDRYLSTGRILVKDGKNAFTRTTAEASSQGVSNQLDEQAIRSEVEIIQSDLLARQVLDKLDASDLDEFGDPSKGDGLLASILGMARSPEKIEFQALEEFRERLSVYSIEKSRVIVIEFWAHDPLLAQKVVSLLSTIYVDFKLQENAKSQENATGWLDPRIKELEEAVNSREAAVAEYRASEDLLRVNNENALLATQQLSEISTELSRLKAERSSTQARANSIRSALRSGVSIDVIPEVLQSQLIQRLREREVDLEAQVSDLSVTLLPGHPRLKSLNSQLAKLRNQIRSAAQDVVTSLERNVAATKDAEAELSQEISRLKSEAARVDEKLVELRSREREAQTARDLLAEYRSRSLEAKSRIGLTQSNVEIISPASYPTESYFPKVLPFTIAGTLAMSLLTILMVIASSLVVSVQGGTASAAGSEKEKKEEPAPDDNIKAATRELHEVMGLNQATGQSQTMPGSQQPAGAVSPRIAGNTQPASAAGLGNVAVRHAVKAMLNRGRGRVAVVSPGGAKGSKTAWVLARQLAAHNKKVVLIDFSENSSSTIEMVGNPDRPGFFNLVSGMVGLDAVLVKDRSSRARCLPGGSLYPGQTMPPPKAVSDAVDGVAGLFEFCILDCGDIELEDLNVVADEETIALVSALRADDDTINDVVYELEMDGFKDVLRVMPDQEDMTGAAPKAA